MKFLVVVIWACAAMALVEGRARGRRDAEENDASCPGDLTERARQCLSGVEGVERVQELTSLEEYRQFFNTYCQAVPTVKQCLHDITEASRTCVNQTQQQVVQMYVSLMRATLDSGCDNHGEPLATIFHGFQTQEDDDEHVVKVCLREVDTRSNATTGRLTLYNNLGGLKACLLARINAEDEDLKNAVGNFINDLRRDIKCIHPEDNTLVLCSSIATD